MSKIYNEQRQLYYARSTRKIVKSELIVSIVVPCYNPPISYFEELLSSVFAQSYGGWELLLVDGSTDSQISDYIERKSKSDNRISYMKVVNKGIASNTNKGISVAIGQLIAFLDHDDTLDPDALAYAVEQFEQSPDLGLVYSDEDKLSSDSMRYMDPHFKPDFSLDMLRNVNYITHFVVANTKLVRQVGGIRLGYDGAQDFDFLLRIVDTGAFVRHIPRILYHWRLSENSTAADFSNKQHITDAGAKALNDHYERMGIKNAQASAIANRPGFYIAKYSLKPANRAIVIMLPEKYPEWVKEFITSRYAMNDSIRKHNVEIIPLRSLEDWKFPKYESVMFVRSLVIPSHIESQVAQLFAVAEESGVYAVSPKIVADGKIEDMGLVSIDKTLVPLFSGMDGDGINPFGSLEWVRNVSALSARVYIMSKASMKDNIKKDPGFIMSSKGRHVVWSHIEMIGLTDLRHDSSIPSTQNNFYNDNLSFNYAPVIHRGVPVSELIRERDNEGEEKTE